MNKEQITTNLTETDVVTELQASNKDLRGKLQLAEQDFCDVVLYIEDVTLQRVNHISHLLSILPRLAELDRPSVLTALHGIVDELENDLQLIAEQNVDELKERRNGETYKLARGY